MTQENKISSKDSYFQLEFDVAHEDKKPLASWTDERFFNLGPSKIFKIYEILANSGRIHEGYDKALFFVWCKRC